MKVRVILLLLVVCLLWGCRQEAPAETVETVPPVKTVGLCLPGRGTDWREQAQRIVTALEAEGIQVRLEYGTEDVLLQQSQVQGLLRMPVDCLVLGGYDPLTLCESLEGTEIPVLAYDRLLQMTDAVDGFVMADYYDAGRQMATFALEQYPEKEQITVELLMGKPQDPNSLRFYQGVMSVLQPMLSNGKVACLSGRIQFEDVCLTEDDLEEARDVCYDYLGREYENTFPDIIIAGNDAMAEGCTQALEGMAFTPEESWPVVTGLGGTEDGLLLMEYGYLTATAKLDQEALAAECVRWVLALLEGQPLPEGDTLHNGQKDVPGSLQKMQLIS